MGSLVRQRLIAHLSRREPCFRSCPRRLGFLAQSYATAAGSGNDEAASSSSSSSSWFQRLKGVFKGTTAPETQPQTQQPKVPEPMASDPKATLPGDFTMENFADELKKARQFGSMTTFGRGLPRGGEMSAVKSLQRQEDILRALYKRDPVRVGAQQKADVAAECGCTLFDVENVVSKYEWAKEANRRVKKLEAEGKPLPKTLNEVEALMGGSWSAAASVNLAKSGNISRNAPCPCGSKKKYKRCCGKNAVEA